VQTISDDFILCKNSTANAVADAQSLSLFMPFICLWLLIYFFRAKLSGRGSSSVVLFCVHAYVFIFPLFMSHVCCFVLVVRKESNVILDNQYRKSPSE